MPCEVDGIGMPVTANQPFAVHRAARYSKLASIIFSFHSIYEVYASSRFFIKILNCARKKPVSNFEYNPSMLKQGLKENVESERWNSGKKFNLEYPAGMAIVGKLGSSIQRETQSENSWGRDDRNQKINFEKKTVSLGLFSSYKFLWRFFSENENISLLTLT